MGIIRRGKVKKKPLRFDRFQTVQDTLGSQSVELSDQPHFSGKEIAPDSTLDAAGSISFGTAGAFLDTIEKKVILAPRGMRIKRCVVNFQIMWQPAQSNIITQLRLLSSSDDVTYTQIAALTYNYTVSISAQIRTDEMIVDERDLDTETRFYRIDLSLGDTPNSVNFKKVKWTMSTQIAP